MSRQAEDRAQGTTDRNAEGLTPAQVMERAQPGDLVRFTMRGPLDDAGARATMRALQAHYPGVEFELHGNGSQSHAEVVRRGRPS